MKKKKRSHKKPTKQAGARGTPVMDLSSVPYLLVSRDLEYKDESIRVYFCTSLLDHLVLAIGLTPDKALEGMTDELQKKYGGEKYVPGEFHQSGEEV